MCQDGRASRKPTFSNCEICLSRDAMFPLMMYVSPSISKRGSLNRYSLSTSVASSSSLMTVFLISRPVWRVAFVNNE